MLSYALITPAYNEERHLVALIESVAAQTLRPIRWVIVSDGSTDRTDEIVRSYRDRYDWIQLLRLERDPDRHFGAKANAVNTAFAALHGLSFDLIGNLDADITLPPDYYEFLVARFAEMPELGVAGTPFLEDPSRPHEHSYNHRFANLSHVSGACQFFRRRCFEELGGYTPIRHGGIDWVAVTTARMNGWTTRTFLERACFHHRAMGTADRNLLQARLRHGREEYMVGSHPLWQIVRCVFQMKSEPFILGGLCLWLGYASAALRRVPSPVPSALRAYHRREQLNRLRRIAADTVLGILPRRTQPQSL
jgi:glycosyltransferase involved in cell wall biosynthesis